MDEVEPIEAEAADENAVAPRGTHLASTQTITHEYLTQSGKVMRETVGSTVMDFAYDESGKPFAMIDQLSAQPKTYYYVLNLQGDVVKLVTESGAVVASYEYDAWGNILASSGSMAEKNPLRYRGYYYDNETGYYYLHSRYYNPEWGRFINAEDFNYLNTKNRFNLNAYMYSWNSPIVFEASKGTEPQISININDILSFIKSSAEKIKNGLTAEYDRISKLFNNWSNAIHARCKAIADKISYFFKYPEAVLNTMFSATSKVVSSIGSAVRFGLIEFIRSNIASKLIEVKDNKSDYNNSEDSEVSTFSICKSQLNFPDDQKTNNWFEVALKILVFGIETDTLTKWFSNIITVTNEFFEGVILTAVTAINTMFLYFKDTFNDSFMDALKNWSVGEFVSQLFGESIGSFLDLFDIYNSFNENFSNQHLVEYSIIASFVDIGSLMLTIAVPGLVISNDMANDLIKQILSNMELGYIWGKI